MPESGHLEVIVRAPQRSFPVAGVLPLACALWLGCASPPPAPAQPTPPQVKRVVVQDRPDLVRYRALTREDFRSSTPPPQGDTSRGHVAAVTCAYLVYAPELRFRAVKEPGASEFEVLVDNLSFLARMDPQCSWWDPRGQFAPEYVLQHEQIHFAIVELVARELNRRAPEIVERMRKRAATGEAALAAAKQEFNAEFEVAVQRALDRNRSFDQETSLGFKPEQQTLWAQRIEQELEETAAHASPSAQADPTARPDAVQQR
jgi:hypothetical protein